MSNYGILLRNCDLYTPEPAGITDLITLNGKVLSIGKVGQAEIMALKALDVELDEFDCKNGCLLPGFVDAHLHFNGAGGEGGAVYRTPPLQLSDLTRAGITSAVGLLGTDGYARSLRELLMKARALDEEGVSTWIYTGSYQIPSPTFTGDVASDIILIDKVIGLKVAYSDHRASQVSVQALQCHAARSRVGGIMAGKSGLVMVHIGDGEHRLEPLLSVAAHSDIPLTQFMPTHLNRSVRVFRQAVAYGRAGGRVDISSGVSEKCCFPGAVKPSHAAAQLLSEGVAPELITMSSDGNGVMTRTDPCTGQKQPLMAPVSSMLDEFTDMLREGMAPATAARICSTSAADALRLPGRKGHIEAGADADCLVLDSDLALRAVIAKGRFMIRDSFVRKGLFER